MNTTANYISELLYRYECVIIPEFGAFLTRRQPATIHQPTTTFSPPQKLISFNSQLQNNDGLLANYIASAENISYTDSLAKIQRYVLSLQQILAEGKKVTLNDIGTFYTSVESTLQFEPANEVNYLTEAFGLQAFTSPAITREVYKKEVETIEENTPITFTPERRNERPYLRYAAIAVIALGVGGIFGLKKSNNNTIVSNSIEEKSGQQMLIDQIQKATFDISDPLPAINLTTTKENNTAETQKYHIIAGAFRIADNASKKADFLKSKGYNARLIGTNKYGLHQVIYDSYQSRAEATLALENIKSNVDPSAWLLVKEL